MADGDQMRQVVPNTGLNAADAMPECGTLRIVTAADPAARTARVEVADTGPGIPDEVRDRLFEPFFTTKSTGTGLGLAIAYGVVERHRGTLAVLSVPDHGTTIVMTLPENGADHDAGGHRNA